MKIFRIKNRRNALATNSSSTHSVVYKNKEQVFEDLGIFDNRYYDRFTETIAASREAKIRYIFANIFYCNELVDMMSERYPEMKEYYPLVREHYDIYLNSREELKGLKGSDYLDKIEDIKDYQFGEHCRGMLYNDKDLHLSYEYLCNIIDSPDIVIVGGSDESDFVYDKIDGCNEISHEFSYMDKFTEKVKNGNYYVLYGFQWGRKEKIRLQVDSIPDMIPEVPELVDIKITNACEHKCPFCYMASTPEGNHADLKDINHIISLFDNKKTEFALGGGNVLLHPYFDRIVSYIDKHNHIANITIRYDDVKTIYVDEKIKRAIDKHVSGIGISVQKASDVDVVRDFIYDMLKKEKHVALHIIPEMIGVNESVAIINKMQEINDTYYNENRYDQTMRWSKCKVLFLGLKRTGRAKTLEHNLLSYNDLTLLFEESRFSFCVDTSFVNTYSDWFTSEYYDSEKLFLTRHEGEYSMFIDAIKKKAYTSSYNYDFGIDINNDTDIADVFGEIRKKNGFKAFEKQVPYYRK